MREVAIPACRNHPSARLAVSFLRVFMFPFLVGGIFIEEIQKLSLFHLSCAAGFARRIHRYGGGWG